MVAVERFAPAGVGWLPAGRIVLGVLVAVLAVACVVQVYRIGEAGSSAVWDFVKQLPPGP